ncbi:MAG: hypothetical protein HYV07_06735 [Deltaproteobacteria bacterium]|nr:hypothetical protein [Deltaproteobacteria bacterium]
MLELSENLSIREFRLEASYTAARLAAAAESTGLAGEHSNAAEKLAELEAEGASLDVAKTQTQAMVEIADDAWDEVALAFQRKLLELSGGSVDHELYRRYFAEIPSQLTRLSYQAEIMISKDLEEDLEGETQDELSAYGAKLEVSRHGLEAALRERTRLEVEGAKYQNRVALAKQLVNRLRRSTWSDLVELAGERGEPWALRFFRQENAVLDAVDADGIAPSTRPQTSRPMSVVAPHHTD